MTEPRRFRLCGCVLETDWPITTRLIETTDAPDLSFAVTDRRPRGGEWVSDGMRGSRGDTIMERGYVGVLEVLQVRGIGDAWFLSDNEIVFHLTAPNMEFQVEVLLLGLLLSYWLEKQGRSALHASAVADDGWAVGLMGPNGTGKSSFALRLMGRGSKFLTDDLLTVSMGEAVMTYPSFPQARLWPEEAERLLGSTDGMEKAHPHFDKLRVPVPEEQMVTGPAPLTGLYVRRTGGGSGIERVKGPPALFHLMFNSFALELVDAPASRAAWLERLGRMIGAVPIYSLPKLGETEEEAAMVAAHANEVAAQSNRSG